MSDPDRSYEMSPTPLTRDFIGLCIGILSVVLVILIVAICKWSRCLCLRRSNENDDPNSGLSSIVQPNTSTPHPFSRHRSHYRSRSSSCDQRPTGQYRYMSGAREAFPSPPQLVNNNGFRLNDIKVPRVTITTLPVQPSQQQQVPRLSISPQVSGSSIARSTYSFKQ